MLTWVAMVLVLEYVPVGHMCYEQIKHYLVTYNDRALTEECYHIVAEESRKRQEWED